MVLVIGCDLLKPAASPARSNSPVVSTTAAPTPTAGPTRTPTPSPTPTATSAVRSVVVIATPGEAAAQTPSGMAWSGVHSAAGTVGATSSLVAPLSPADVEAAPETAASGGASVVVSVAPQAGPAMLAAALAHPAVQFIVVDQNVPAGAPANLHGIVFDEAEAGYLAGYIAASLTQTGRIGMVGDSASDTRTRNYLAGFKAGATFARSNVKVTVAYAGTGLAPEKGRAASTSLIKGHADVLLTLPSLSGIGAMRDACSRKATLIAADTDAWSLVPDVQRCVAVSVRKRYDVAVEAAIVALAAGQTLPALTMADVASGGIDLSDFHVQEPADLPGKLSALLAALASQPPRSP